MKDFLMKSDSEKLMTNVEEVSSECGSSQYKKSEDDETKIIKQNSKS